MQRENWVFTYHGKALAEAAQKKVAFHTARLEWWNVKKVQVTATIRSEGIEIDEKIALTYSNPKARDYDRGGEILIRNDLRSQLAECFQKLAYHTEKCDDYDAWIQALSANPEQFLELHIDDWLFFFGRN